MSDTNGTLSVVLASVYRVRDPVRMWVQVKERRAELARLGAHHAVLYHSTRRAGLVLITIGVRHRAPVADLMRSPAIREWFDVADVEDYPMVFAGDIVEKVDLGTTPDVAPGIVVAVFAGVESVDEVVTIVHGAADRFSAAGVRKLWIYHALDDPQEMLFLHEFDDIAHADEWINHPQAEARWMCIPKHGVYPPPFVGELADVLPVGASE